jgi:hypothetical protein
MVLTSCSKNRQPLSINPDNPHYFLFRGKPLVLIGSTEHYGAVLNLDFDYKPYLDELESKGLNVTRTFSGIYLEPQGAFKIEKNTLAPEEGKLICPWARSDKPGYAKGGNKFDLNRWDAEYFKRLKDFISEAGKRDIIVELDLFSNFYDTAQWKLSPLYIENNINQAGDILNHKEVLSLKHPELIEIQEKMVRQIVTELRGFDNLYYEVCNEPYFGDLEALEAWEKHMTSVIADAEKDYRFKHLISQNIANGSKKIEDPDPLVSIFNFHYSRPPLSVEMNWHLNKPIGDNETGFRGTADFVYRAEAWEFLVAGGALYNNLDYSFTTSHEDGSFKVPPGQPGGGGPSLRTQLKILKEVFDGLDFISMKPLNGIIKSSYNGLTSVRVLAREGKDYLIYLCDAKARTDKTDSPAPGVLSLSVELPQGSFSGYWIDTRTGVRTGMDINDHPGGIIAIETPPFTEDIALLIRNKQ